MSLEPFSLELEESDLDLRVRKKNLIDALKLLPFSSAQSVVNYFRIMHSTALDLYFTEPFIQTDGRYPDYDQPDNYRKALFRGREVLRSLLPEERSAVIAKNCEAEEIAADIDKLVDVYC